MPHDSSAGEETKAWLEKARKADLTSADILLNSGNRSQLHQVLFHCQQAAEKSLKAFLVFHKITFRWTHDLGEIGDQCSKIESSLEKLIGEVKYLSDYAWEYRYPGEEPDPTLKQAKAGLKDAARVFSSVAGALPSELRPASVSQKKAKKKKTRRR